jgi:N-dimethylarginine dimethylaminohydrolase
MKVMRVCIQPNTFNITSMQDKQNPYIDIKHSVQGAEAAKEHQALVKVYRDSVVVYRIETDESLPDLVFVANGGLSLPRLPEPMIILPLMKYSQRKRELPYLKNMFDDLGVRRVVFPGPAPFEGQAEIKWFKGGELAVAGYGHRSTKKTFEILDKLLGKIYRKAGLNPPKILALPLESDDYYHLDVAMLEFSRRGLPPDECIVHKRAFSEKSIARLKEFLGAHAVHVIDTADSFCLNSVVDGKNLITHKITDPKAKEAIEYITGLKIREVDTREFEKSGGSVRCMTMDIYVK